MTKTRGATAVMADKAPKIVEADTELQALHRSLNFFPTEPWVGRAGAQVLQELIPAGSSLIEPAAGEGHMAGPFGETFDVYASDIHDHGAGFPVRDFLLDADPWPAADWVATNPPFKHAEAFIHRGLEIARYGAAMLCRLQFGETSGRYPLLRRVALKAVFAERIDIRLGRWIPGGGGGATAMAYFIFLTEEGLAASPFRGAIETAWSMGCTLERIIPPGTKRALTRAGDAARYGWVEPGGMFADEGEGQLPQTLPL